MDEETNNLLRKTLVSSLQTLEPAQGIMQQVSNRIVSEDVDRNSANVVLPGTTFIALIAFFSAANLLLEELGVLDKESISKILAEIDADIENDKFAAEEKAAKVASDLINRVKFH